MIVRCTYDLFEVSYTCCVIFLIRVSLIVRPARVNGNMLFVLSNLVVLGGYCMACLR